MAPQGIGEQASIPAVHKQVAPLRILDKQAVAVIAEKRAHTMTDMYSYSLNTISRTLRHRPAHAWEVVFQDRLHWLTIYGRRFILQDRRGIEAAGDELRVLLSPLSSPHRTRAIAGLCEELNRRPTIFPGSRLRLKFAVVSPKLKGKRTIS